MVVGAGHNGLVAACYLARAGRDVLVLEHLDRPGGGSRTEETIPGHRFDLHSVAHNIINMTAIPEELDLDGAGLRYLEMNPFSMAAHADGRIVRFWRSVEATVESIAAHDPAEAAEYRRFVETGDLLVEAMLPAVRGGGPPRRDPEACGGRGPAVAQGVDVRPAQPLRHAAAPPAGERPHPWPGRRVRRARRSGPQRRRRCSVRVLAGGVPPVRTVARHRRRPEPDRRARRAARVPSAPRCAARPRSSASRPEATTCRRWCSPAASGSRPAT